MTEKDKEITFEPLDENRVYEVKKKTLNVRSVKTNASIHMFLKLVSESLNNGGFTVQKVVALFQKADINWSMLAVKDIIWRNIQIAITGKESTTQLEQHEVTKVYKTVIHYLTTKVGIDHIEFPSIESMIYEQNKDKY